MITEPNAKSKIISPLMILLIISTVVALWLGSSWYINTYINVDYRGTFGDMFGAVNSLFSGLAFAGLIYTITVQRQELQEQRKSIQMQTDELTLQRQALEMQTEELKMQREETARSADQLQMQQELMDYQLILSTVNDLIKVKNEAVSKLNMEFRQEVESLKKRRQEEKDQLSRRNFATSAMYLYQEPEPIPKKLFQGSRKQLRQFEETCFFILQFIIDNKLSEKQTNNLKKIVKVNLTADEIQTLERVVSEDNNQHRLLLLKAFELGFQ